MDRFSGRRFELDNDAPVDILQSGSANHLVVSSEGVVIQNVYNPEYIRGIPESVFNVDNEISGQIQAKSGRMFDYFVKPDHINFRDASDPYFHFDAYVMHGELHLDIYTKEGETRHPDLYATELLTRACEWFESQGIKIEYISDLWLDGDNLAAFREGINNGDDCICAALATWTGQFAQNNLGMNRVIVQDKRADKVTALFFRDYEA